MAMAAWPVALSIGEAIGTTAMVFIALCLPWLVIRLYADVDEFFNRARDQTALGKTETQATIGHYLEHLCISLYKPQPTSLDNL